MISPVEAWPYLPTLGRVALAVALGLFVGVEREHRGKQAGLRTFTFATLLGALGGLLGTSFALIALALLGVLIVLLNLETLRTGEGVEVTTSAALLVAGFTGVLAGQGHAFTATVVAVATVALLAWKEPLAGFSHALTDAEIRSAILLAIIAFIVYPVLPRGPVDPWGLIEPREAWLTVIFIAAFGFANYVLLKGYGHRGVEIAGFLGGVVNSTVTVAELARRANQEESDEATAWRGMVLALSAMLVRNVLLLGALAPGALLRGSVPFAFMVAAAVILALHRGRGRETGAGEPVRHHGERTVGITAVGSPFSLKAALQFGVAFLLLQVVGTLAQRALGESGFYGVSVLGGVVSSASAVASAGALAGAGTVSNGVAAWGALLASVASMLVNLPIVARVGHRPALTRRMVQALGIVLLLGAIGAAAQAALPVG
ncbi:MAG TPA: MgtC/SapB family protein [Gemmatimonadales bacterium]|nr:MgtC/SapB family protein [Gemmatimonadales bacterium]